MFQTALLAVILAVTGTAATAHKADVSVSGCVTDVSIVLACQARQSNLHLSEDSDDVRVRVIVICPEADRLRRMALSMVKTYYRLHAVEDSTIASELEDIYAPMIDPAGQSVDRDDHLADLASCDER